MTDLRELIDEYTADTGALERTYAAIGSARRNARLERHFDQWLDRLNNVEFEALSDPHRVDFVLLRSHVQNHRCRLQQDADQLAALIPLVPFAQAIIDLLEKREDMAPADPRQAASRLVEIKAAASASCQAFKESSTVQSRNDAYGASKWLKSLYEALKSWHTFYSGYDPEFTWWTGTPFADADKALTEYLSLLEDPPSADNVSDIPGVPVGRERLEADLRSELIPYSPEELIETGEREYAWCLGEMKRASAELGFGDDWHAALEHVKELHAPPGRQASVVRSLALEAIEYVESHDLLTVPDLAKETWRMKMMSPEKQLINPFFLGGEAIIVSYPTDTMSHSQKLMSMRGNNPHFSRATVQHELIPGHHMQQFMTQRFHAHRSLFSTPFWIEGWTLHWEMLLWDLGFPVKPEDRIGMLFWRMHRCVRIFFSLRFHLGQMTSRECVDVLVEKVGHERANAEGEVRRSFRGDYPPLYQAAYMIGGLQVRALHREMVGGGRMTQREFHDRFMHENEMPIAVLRALMRGDEIPAAGVQPWRFLDYSNKP